MSSVPEGAYVVTTDEKGKPLQPQNVPIEIELFKPDIQWVSSRKAFPMQMGIISISRMMISANR